MANKQKFCEVFGEETFDSFIKKLCSEEISVNDIILWFYSDYPDPNAAEPAPKRRGRKPKKEVE